MLEDLRLQRKSLDYQTAAILQVEGNHEVPKLIGVVDSDKLTVSVPDGFTLTEGTLYMPAYETQDFEPLIVKHPMSPLDLSAPLRSYERQLSELIRQRRALYGPEKVNRLRLKIPVVASISFTSHASERRVRALYNLRCLVSWNQQDSEARVRIEMVGFGFWKVFDSNNSGFPGSNDKADMQWLERIFQFQRELMSS